jgi:hypothetical protein
LIIIDCAFIAAAFATNNFSRFKSSRTIPTFLRIARSSVDAPSEKNNASTDGDDVKTMSPNNKCAIIFLHGLGDSPDGWSTIAEALPNLRPSLAKLDITYVFPPAQMVAITVNGGEKMPGVLSSFMLRI